MQKAYASKKLTQLMGMYSSAPGAGVHVESGAHLERLAFHADAPDGSDVLHADCQPDSYVPGVPATARPLPPLRCACLPEFAGGTKPEATNARKRPTVT